MSNKLVTIMLDGLRYDTAMNEMGFLGHLVETKRAALYQVKSEIPSLSRPLYEMLLTGVKPIESGIVSNQTVRLSHEESIFHLAKKHGLTNATASYYWVSELYKSAPFSPFTDRILEDEKCILQHGMFYFEDDYPDTHVFADAEYLMKKYDPNFLYVHSMNIDDIGHKYTADSKEYRLAAFKADQILANIIPIWLDRGYDIIVTSDHGMNADGNHGGLTDDVRHVPLFILSDKVVKESHEEIIQQSLIAPLMCRLLDIPISIKMEEKYIPGWIY